MNNKIKIGIVGYGNLGKGTELAVNQSADMELTAIFSRRKLAKTISGTPAVLFDNIADYQGKIDVMLLCGGSATDLEQQGPLVASMFNTVDSFDTHPRIPEYFAIIDEKAKSASTAAIISVGWDPGLFSLNRLLAEAVLPNGKDYTFWGKGVSQGHSDAIRRIKGVKNAKQYTIPKEQVINAVRSGQRPATKSNEAHLRDCYIVPEEGADLQAIETAVKTMPNYFVGYETIVHFIDDAEFAAQHSTMPHGGFVFRSGETADGVNHVMEFALKLDSNPEFTASVLTAYARAAYRLRQHGGCGAYSVLDIPFAWLSPKSGAELRKNLL